MQNQGENEAKILGAHLEGTFLNPENQAFKMQEIF